MGYKYHISEEKLIFFILVFIIFILSHSLSQDRIDIPNYPQISIADFLPKNYKKDGSVSYQNEIQKVLDDLDTAALPAIITIIRPRTVTAGILSRLKTHFRR